MIAVQSMLAADAELPACDGRLRELHDYWRSIHPAGGLLPGRRHFDPNAVARLLPWIWLVDVHRGPLRFKYRLIGTVLVDMEGRNQAGRWTDEAHPHFVKSDAEVHFTGVAECGDIGYYKGPVGFVVQKNFLSIERVLMPLAADGRTVDMLLGITVPIP